MRIITALLVISIILLWVRIMNLEDGMDKANDAVKLLASGLMELKNE